MALEKEPGEAAKGPACQSSQGPNYTSSGKPGALRLWPSRAAGVRGLHLVRLDAA
jgi:hypothetical protein